MSSLETLTLTVDQTAIRLDNFLAQAIPHLSRTQLQKMIRQGDVVMGKPITRPSLVVHFGDTLMVTLAASVAESAPQPESIPLHIVYEDEAIVVINKMAGMVVHPAEGHTDGTLVNALLARYPDLAAWPSDEEADHDRPGIVHRLDQDTSGLLVVARTPEAQHHLQAQFKARTVQKTYLALVFGHPPAPEGIIDVPLGRDTRFRQRIAPQANGKPARTRYRTRQKFNHHTLLEVDLETGRTHQIRVHLAWLKCAVVGDTVYGRKKNDLGLTRQFLHAWQLQFIHPVTQQPMAFEAPLDEELAQVIADLTNQL